MVSADEDSAGDADAADSQQEAATGRSEEEGGDGGVAEAGSSAAGSTGPAEGSQQRSRRRRGAAVFRDVEDGGAGSVSAVRSAVRQRWGRALVARRTLLVSRSVVPPMARTSAFAWQSSRSLAWGRSCC